MRDPWRDILYAVYCTECMKTVNFVKVEQNGKCWYVCAGNARMRQEGCGHRIQLRTDGIKDEQGNRL